MQESVVRREEHEAVAQTRARRSMETGWACKGSPTGSRASVVSPSPSTSSRSMPLMKSTISASGGIAGGSGAEHGVGDCWSSLVDDRISTGTVEVAIAEYTCRPCVMPGPVSGSRHLRAWTSGPSTVGRPQILRGVLWGNRVAGSTAGWAVRVHDRGHCSRSIDNASSCRANESATGGPKHTHEEVAQVLRTVERVDGHSRSGERRALDFENLCDDL